KRMPGREILNAVQALWTIPDDGSVYLNPALYCARSKRARQSPRAVSGGRVSEHRCLLRRNRLHWIFEAEKGRTHSWYSACTRRLFHLGSAPLGNEGNGLAVHRSHGHQRREISTRGIH